MMQNEHQSGPPHTEEVHLQDYINVIFRRRKPALITFIAIVVLVVLYTLLSTPVYEAMATLHVQEEKVKGGDLLGDLGLTRDNPIETEIEILKSRTNAEEVVRRLQLNWGRVFENDETQVRILEFASLDDDPEYRVTLLPDNKFTIKGNDWKSPIEGESGKRVTREGFSLILDQLQGAPGDRFKLILSPFNRTVQGLRGGVNANELGKGTNIIRLSYRANNPLLARDVVNTLATTYLDRNVIMKTEEARKSVDFIRQQLDEVRQLLDNAEQSLQDYKRDNGVIKLDSEVEILIERLSMVDKERSAEKLRSRQAEFAIQALKKALKQGRSYAPSSLLDDPVLAGLATELARFEVERQGLLNEFTESHPSVMSLSKRIVAGQEKMLSSYQSLQSGLKFKIADLDTEIDTFEQQLKSLPEAEQQLARLTRLATVNADIYTFLLHKHEEARIARASTISSINIIDPAITPENPVKPNKKKNFLLALIVGAMAGIGIAFFIEYLDDTIKDAETAKQLLGVPILAIIPFIEPQSGSDDAEFHSKKEERSLITHLEPRSPAAEAFRSLRTGLHFASVGKEHQVLLVSSSFPGEGKTTVSANLAETIAKTGARVLLVGCDLRRPSLHTIFERSCSPGLTELLIGDVEIEAAIHKTGINSLDFMSAGMTPPNPAELVGSDKMKAFIENVKLKYDVVILDAPPVLAVTDASLLSELADHMLIVLEVGRVQIRAAQRMKELVTNMQIDVAGLVINDKSGKGQEYYSYYRDRYGRYGYGQYGYYSSGYGSEPPVKTSRLDRLKRIFRKS
jgi:tyrosine-protein kinase Etk/Wzc